MYEPSQFRAGIRAPAVGKIEYKRSRDQTLRGLLLGDEIGHSGWLTVVWCVGLAVLGYFWSKSLFNREPK